MNDSSLIKDIFINFRFNDRNWIEINLVVLEKSAVQI